MALEKQVFIDQIMEDDKNVIRYREATRIVEDGRELSKTYHRADAFPGSDVSKLPERVAAIASTVWTPEVIAAYNAQIAEEEAARQADLAARNAAALGNVAPNSTTPVAQQPA